jgi:hypothetical protein
MKRVRVAVATVDLGNVSGRFVTAVMVSIVALVIAGYSARGTDDILPVGVNFQFTGSLVAR